MSSEAPAPPTAPASRVVLVTGASGGVGRGIALACAADGWTVWIAARRAEEGARVAAEVDAAGGRGRFVTCDVTVADSVRTAVDLVVEKDRRLDAIVHNSTSGLSPVPVDPTTMSLRDLRDHVAVSVTGLRHLATAGLGPLRERGGSMVVLTSEAGFEGKARLAPYAAVKAAQRGIVRALAREWGPVGVRVNCVAPLAATSAMERAFELDADMAARVLGRIPLGRLGDPEADVGAVVRLLISDDARFVTGATLMVDGGSCPIA
ncbi:MAG: SDR family NAD(P)-dependent oxidoreductase [Microthrixaceae bacterium]